VGLRATRDGQPLEIATRAVVLCDGGFQSSQELLREFITPAPERLMQRNARAGLGDGLRMAREAGAKLLGMDRFYGHVLAQEAMHVETLSPFPMLDLTCSAGIVVDASGRRFMDESLGGVTMANTMAAQADPLGAVAIFDEPIWNGPGREYLIPANPTLINSGGRLFSAASLRELAALAGLPVDMIEATVARYNEGVDSGRLGELVPPRNGGGHRAWPIRTAPFHAVRLCVGITYTMGGIAIDTDARVLNRDDKPIMGLYAAGCATGGVEGGGTRPEVAYIGGLTRSTVFALRAADHIMRARTTVAA
jgi:fumarate reductase flavoprotein subunit